MGELVRFLSYRQEGNDFECLVDTLRTNCVIMFCPCAGEGGREGGRN